MKRVAVTGLGLICSLGHSVYACWERMRAGDTGILPLQDPGNPPYKFRVGAEVRGYDPLCWFSDKDLLTVDRFAQFAAVAAREAVSQSGLAIDAGQLADRTAVVVGTGVGGQITEDEGYVRIYRDGIPRAAPLTIPRVMANAGASRISLEHGITGPVYTVSTACSSANHAIGQAFWMVRSGQVDAVVTGGSDAIFAEGLLRAWEALRVVSNEACRPFSADRKGLTLGEAGGMLVLEEWDHARQRGAEILAEIVGFGMSSDAHHLTQPAVEGFAKAMLWALNDACVDPAQVQYVNAHGTGTVANDAVETEALQQVFGPSLGPGSGPLVSSTKSMHGHTQGAAGAVEAIASIMAIREGIIPPTINYSTPDPACRLNHVTNAPHEAFLNYAMSNTFAFGGLNAVLVFRKTA